MISFQISEKSGINDTILTTNFQTAITLQILRRIGEGGYGLVFQVVNIQNPIQLAAMKTEPVGMLNDDQILKMEVHVLKKLNKSQHACKIYASGKVEKSF